MDISATVCLKECPTSESDEELKCFPNSVVTSCEESIGELSIYATVPCKLFLF